MFARMPLPWKDVKGLSAINYQCGYCNRIVGPNEGYVTDHPRQYSIRICPNCNRPTYFEGGNQTPGVSFGNPVKHLPIEVEPLYNEARVCTAATAHTAAVLAVRKILMHIAVEKGAKPDLSFLGYVDYLASNGYVPPNGKGWVDYIRKKGNDANHEIVLMNQEDSQKLITFVEMLLKFIYEFPEEIPKPP